ncbi:MAG: EI24 domain-containing protein [Victivallaceae bacterium]|nr:EI24 domain-containing protein [Victivallaceae bacterium]
MTGLSCIVRGLKIFYSTPSYWRSLIAPLALLLLFYLAVLAAAVLFGRTLLSFLPDPAAWNEYLRWLAVALRWIVVAGFALTVAVAAALLSNSVFEAFGSLFFDGLVAKFERDFYHRSSERPIWRANLYCVWKSSRFAVGTLLGALFGAAVGLFVPGFGFLIAPALIGCRVGCSYLWSPLLLHGGIAEYRKFFRRGGGELWCFGFVVSLVLSLPVIGIFAVPGFVIGGAIFYNERLDAPPADGVCGE